MTLEEFERRIQLGEDSTTEFKGVEKTGFRIDPHDLGKAVCALANGAGGLIVLGVEDDGTVSGTGNREQTDMLMRQAVQICQQNIHPAIWCAIRKEGLQDRTLLLLTVPGFSTNRPYRAGHVYYIREGSESREASRDDLVRLLQSADVHFDETSVTGSRFDDLETQAVESFLFSTYPEARDKESMQNPKGRHETMQAYLRALGCLDSNDVPTVAGLLLFGKNPQRWLPDVKISAVRIEGVSYTTDIQDRQEFESRLEEQIVGAAGFLDSRLPSPSHVENWKRQDKPAPGRIPSDVLREAVLNAVTHRDYRASSQVRIFVFDDRVEIVNPGTLLNRLTLDGIRIGGISQRRNPVVAALLSRMAGRENLGFGIPDMRNRMRDAGLPEPIFSLEAGHFRVVLGGFPAPPE